MSWIRNTGHQYEGRQLPETLVESMPRRLTEDIALDGLQQCMENNLYIRELKYFLPLKFVYNE
jgi:hypothetical protein